MTDSIELNECITIINELTESLKERNNEIEAIFNIIYLRIKENQELATLHYPEVEDKYINEYDSRADELIQLSKILYDDNLVNNSSEYKLDKLLDKINSKIESIEKELDYCVKNGASTTVLYSELDLLNELKNEIK